MLNSELVLKRLSDACGSKVMIIQGNEQIKAQRWENFLLQWGTREGLADRSTVAKNREVRWVPLSIPEMILNHKIGSLRNKSY